MVERPRVTKIIKGNALAMARAGKMAPSVTLKARMEECTSIAMGRLARVLLNTRVMTMVNARAVRVMQRPPETELRLVKRSVTGLSDVLRLVKS